MTPAPFPTLLPQMVSGGLRPLRESVSREAARRPRSFDELREIAYIIPRCVPLLEGMRESSDRLLSRGIEAGSLQAYASSALKTVEEGLSTFNQLRLELQGNAPSEERDAALAALADAVSRVTLVREHLQGLLDWLTAPPAEGDADRVLAAIEQGRSSARYDTEEEFRRAVLGE